MDVSAEENMLLAMLEEGKMDGDVGETRIYRVYNSVRCGKYIEDGIPITFREGRIRSNLLGREDNSLPIVREEEKCLSEESKLLFLQKYGWLIYNECARNYSKKYKP